MFLYRFARVELIKTVVSHDFQMARSRIRERILGLLKTEEMLAFSRCIWFPALAMLQFLSALLSVAFSDFWVCSATQLVSNDRPFIYEDSYPNNG